MNFASRDKSMQFLELFQLFDKTTALSLPFPIFCLSLGLCLLFCICVEEVRQRRVRVRFTGLIEMNLYRVSPFSLPPTPSLLRTSHISIYSLGPGSAGWLRQGFACAYCMSERERDIQQTWRLNMRDIVEEKSIAWRQENQRQVDGEMEKWGVCLISSRILTRKWREGRFKDI